MVWDGTAFILWQGWMRQDCIHFLTRWYETGLHSFLWQDCMRQDCIHFYDKIVWDRTASIFGQDGMRPDCIHFYDKIVWDRTAFIFMTRQHKTGTHPFYIGIYIHIRTHIYVHIHTSQKECLCIFYVGKLLQFLDLNPVSVWSNRIK